MKHHQYVDDFKVIYYSHLKDQTEVSDVLTEAKKQSSQLEGTAGRLSD